MLKKLKNKYKNLTLIMCGFCNRDIIKEHEKDQKIFKKDDKPMCMICRATKLSVFQKDIENSKPRMEKDLKDINNEFDSEEFKRVVHIAAKSQAEMEKNSKK